MSYNCVITDSFLENRSVANSDNISRRKNIMHTPEQRKRGACTNRKSEKIQFSAMSMIRYTTTVRGNPIALDTQNLHSSTFQMLFER